MFQYILVAVIVLFCLLYAVRKIVRILRGRDRDGCAFCSGGTPQSKTGASCIGCVQRDRCASDPPNSPTDASDTSGND